MATLQERLNAAKKDTRGANLGVRQYSGSLQDRLNAAKMDTGTSFTGVTARDAASAFRQAAAREQPEPLLSGLGGKGAAQLAQGALFTPEQRTQAAENRLKKLDEIAADLKAFEMATQYAPANQRPVKDIGGFTSSQAAREEYNRVMAEYAALLKENGKTDGNFGRNVRYALEKGGAGLGAALEGLGDAGAAALLDGRVGKALSGISPAVNIVQQVDKLTGDRVGELADKMMKSNPSAQRMRDIESRYAPSKAGQVAGEVAQGVGGMLPSIAANIALPGSGMAVLGVQAGGQSAQQALNEGAALEQAVNYGVLSGGLEAATEAMFGGITGLGKGFLNTAAGKGVGKLIAKLGTSKAGQVLSALAANPLVKALGDSLGEGVEEGVSAVLSPYLERLTYNKEAENATVDEVLHDVFVGALTGGVFQGIGLAANLAAGQKNTAYGVETGKGATEKPASQPETDANKLTAKELMWDRIAAEGRRQAAKRAAAAQGGGQESGLGTGKVADAPGQTAPENASQSRKQKVKLPPGVTDMRRRVLSKRESDEVRSIERLAKAADVSVRIVEDMPESEYGRYENGELYLSAWAKEPLMQVAKHEVTHHLQEVAPELYAQYRGQVEQILSERGDLEKAIYARMEAYAEAGQTLDYEAALDEAAADFTEELMLDESLFRRLAQEDRSLAQRILDGLKELLARLKRTLSGGEISKLERASRAWEAALKEVSAQKNTATTSGAVKHSYAGVRAKTADLAALRNAKQQDAEGVDSETVRKETGWFQGADSRRRFEIDDSGMALKTAGEISNYSTLGELVDHPALFEAYPDLAEMGVTFQRLERGVNGQYDKKYDGITLNSALKQEPEALLEVLLHEIQHAIQAREKFSGGSTVERWQRKIGEGFDARRADDRRKARQVEEKLADIRENMPEFYEAMMELNGMVPKVPRGRIDWDALQQIEEDPAEWQKYDARRVKLEEKYGEDAVWDFDSLLDDRTRLAKAGRSADELYYNTAGEIEARDTAKRRGMTAEQRREARPYTGDENTVFADGESLVALSKDSDEAKRIKQQLQDAQDRLREMNPVADVRISERNWGNKYKNWEWAVEQLKPSGYQVDRQGMGKIVFDPKRINTGLDYLNTPGEVAAFVALPRVLKRGIEIGRHSDHKGRDYGTVTFAAPVTINGKTGNMAVVVKMTSENFYKTHRILTPDGKVYELQEMTNAELTPAGESLHNSSLATPISSASKQSISHSAEKSNSKSSLAGVKELERQIKDLQEQNRRLQARNERLRGQMKRTAGAKTDAQEVKRTAGELLKEFSSHANRTEVTERLQKLYDSMANPNGKDAMTEPEMRREAQSIARDVLSEVSVLNDDMYREYSDLRNYLRTTKVMVPQELWGDLDSEGGYNEFRKRNMGRLSLSSTEGRSIDDVYQELSYDYPGLFDQDAVSHPADQLVQMAEIAGNLRPTYENPYAADRAAIDWLAGEIMERFYDLPQQKGTFADRAAARVDEVRRQERRAAQERLQKHLQEQEKRHEKRIANIKESNRQAGKRMRENMSATKLRDAIKRHAEGLSRKLLRPTDRQRIPARLQGSALALLEVIDLESKYAYEFTRDATFKRVNRDETIGEGEPTSRTSAARALKAAYEELRSDPEFNGTVDPDLADKLEEIAKMGDVRLADMGREQLQTVWEAVRAVEASVTKSDKMLGASKYGRISTAAEKMRTEMGDRKDRKNLVGALGKADRLLNLDMLSPETFLHRLGAVGEDIHRQMRRAQDKNVEILKEGVEFYRKAAEETKVDLLKAEKEMHTFKLPGGTIELTTAQVMDLYALSKRRAAMEHIYKGGLRTQDGRKGLVESGKSKAVKVTMMDVADILEALTPEQKKLVDKLQEYMSTRLAAHGNEASMEAYDYEKFKEKAYWPIKVSKTETDTDPASEARAKTIPGFGMTKALQPHANNSVMLRSALDSFGEHLNQMATYAAWLTTSENITKLVNYDFVEGNARTGTVKDLLLKIYGKGGEQYLTKLLSDVAQGTKTGSGEGAFTDSMFGRWKGAKVGANIRVILQQPTAILRAAEMIDAKYMAQTGNPFKGWQKALEWSPIAQWKDWGYFEMDAGRSMRELMAGTRNVLDKTRNVAMAPAGKMDNMAWGMLWNAVEAEMKAKRRDLKAGSDEYYRAVAERFGDVIDRTQVVDSVLHRTQIMRSSNALNRMATSFMSEPSKIYNMVARDIYDIKNSERGSEANKRAWKHVARTSVALTASFAVNAIAQSIADALRDDDRDKEYLEKFGDAYMGNFWQNFDPLGYLPYVKDLESIIQGFTVDRSDMEGLADLVQAAKTLAKAVNGSGNKTVFNAGLETLNKTLDAFGLPASNIKRDVMGVLSTVLQATGAHELTYKVDKVMLDIRKNGNAGVYYDTLYRAMNDDYDAYVKIYNDMVASGMDPEKIVSGMEKRMAKALNLNSTLMLPVDYYAPGAYLQFDQLLKDQQAAGKTWVDSVDFAQVELAYQLEDIKSEAGANERRMRRIADSEYSESVKEASMKRVMGTAAYNRYLVARDAKISTYDYVNLLDDIKAATLKRRGESGSASQDDVVEALRQSGLTGAQKRAVWYSYGYKSESPWG